MASSGVFKKPIGTKIVKFSNFYLAEGYHQNYSHKNPIRYKYYRWNSGRDHFLHKVWGSAMPAAPDSPGDPPCKTPVTAAETLNDQVLPFFEEHDIPVLRVLTDRGTEYCGRDDRHPYQIFLGLNEIEHSRTKLVVLPPSPSPFCLFLFTLFDRINVFQEQFRAFRPVLPVLRKAPLPPKPPAVRRSAAAGGW